ncbi:Leucine-rich repeat protein [Handroanthus impetiginosus]|uniref:Leucine-rich repeat protein n=1 Tax=Handroanthus impetiginosus TaxID=429701 RepID=A0A2G9HWS8_9LAMI|nr:Leucine-rich repeat protein [Handroanthus impetiginosus]
MKTLFFLSIFCITCILPAFGHCLDDQKSLLLGLRNSLRFNHSDSTKLVYWNHTKDCCNWDGVECDVFGHVISLHLDGEMISGRIENSEYLFNLSYLEKLNLAFNDFNGIQIPRGISNLANLTHLNLSYAGFAGQVLQEVLRLKKLVSLDLSDNGHPSIVKLENPDLKGRIGLLNLEYIYLIYNFLSGNIPSTLFALPSLQQLCLGDNEFCGQVQELSNLSKSSLQGLDLSPNHLEGPVPKFFSELEQLKMLSLSSNKFNGTVQLDMFRNSGLEFLDLSHYDLFVQSTDSDSSLPLLPNIHLSSNQLNGEIPNWIWEIGNGSLVHLNLSYNLLRGLQKPYKFPSLYNLDLHSNHFRGELPIPPLSSVYVDYSYNKFTNSIPGSVFLSGASFFSVSNNNLTGEIPPSICSATYLRVLDFSANALTEARSLNNCPILEILDIGNNRFEDTFPCMLTKTHLHVLILRSNKFYGDLHCPKAFQEWAYLQIIDISSNNFSGDISLLPFSTWRGMVSANDNKQPEYDHLYVDFPTVSGYHGDAGHYRDAVTVTMKGLEMNLTKILTIFTSIDFLNNKFHGKIPYSIRDLKSLYGLNLSHNELTGSIPTSIGNLTQLGFLDLSVNKLTGKIPVELASLTFISFLNLSYNKLFGKIPEGPQFRTFSLGSFEGNIGLYGCPVDTSCNKKGSDGSTPRFQNGEVHLKREIDWDYVSAALGFASLENRELEGSLPEFAFKGSLPSLSLSCTRFSRNVSETIGRLRMLTNLDLRACSFSGSIPNSIKNLTQLVYFNLSINQFVGPVPSFAFLKKLTTINLSAKCLTGQIPDSLWEGLENLDFLDLSSIRDSLNGSSSSLESLELSINKLEGPVPRFFFDLQNLLALELASNKFNGSVVLTHLRKLTNLVSLDLSHNNLSVHVNEKVPISLLFPRTLAPVRFFSIATNRIIGTTPSSLCNAIDLQILDFSNNHFHGNIPSCLLQKSLRILNLRRSNLSGDIPDTFPVGCALETLDLSWNVLQGKVPRSLERCTEIESISLSNNDLNDSFLCWLKNLSKLRVLVLSFNKIHGNISCLHENSSNWPNLQIINIASNSFHGVLPANLFQNLKAFMFDENGPQSQLDHLQLYLSETNIYYQDSITVTVKGLDIDLPKILTIFTSIDFSNDHFQGIIQIESLYILNLSCTALSGHIPSSIGNLQKLESLDLLFNNFSGQIPRQIASLTFLSFLNLSYNHLVGRIPQGSQMQTFTESSYAGNDGLRGFQLNKTCNDSEESAAMFPRWYWESEEKENSMDSEIYVSAALVFLVGLGVILAPLLFCKRWRRCYNKNLNRFILYDHCYVLDHLLSVTREDLEINPYTGIDGLWLLIYVIDVEYFDVALYFVEKYPNVATLRLPDNTSSLKKIAGKRSLFFKNRRFYPQEEFSSSLLKNLQAIPWKFTKSSGNNQAFDLSTETPMHAQA